MKRLGLAVLCGLLCAVPIFAQDSVETAQRRQLEEMNRQAREKRAAAQRLKGQESKALVQLRRTEQRLAATRRRLRGLDQRRHLLGQQLEVTRASLEKSVATLARRRATLARRLRNLYKYQSSRELEFLLSTDSFGQLLARWDYLVMVAEQDRVLLEDIQAEKEQVESDQQRIEGTLTEVQRTARRTAKENDQLATLRQTRASSVRTIQGQREAYEAAAAELERNARALSRLLAQLEKKRREESDRARAQGRSPEPYTGDFAKGRGALDWPVRGTLVGRFGPETHPKWGTTLLNNGVDIESPQGTPVRAVAKGRVEYTNDDYAGYGQIVILNHGDGFYTLYAHLSTILLAQGVEVAAGQVLGRVGDTGSLKGSVLHFEVRKGGSALDPEEWLK